MNFLIVLPPDAGDGDGEGGACTTILIQHFFFKIPKFQETEKSKNKFPNIFIYTEMTLNLIETFKTSIYNPEQTKNTKTQIPPPKKNKIVRKLTNPYCLKHLFRNVRRFMLIRIELFIFYNFCMFYIFYTLLRDTQPN